MSVQGSLNVSSNATGGKGEVEYPNEIIFSANASGGSLVPITGGDQRQNSSALMLQPGQNVTLSFSGTIVLTGGDIGSQYRIAVFPMLGSTYSVRALFSNNAETLVQVNATA